MNYTKVINIIVTILFIAATIVIVDTWGIKGLLGLLVLVLVMFAYQLYRKWDLFMGLLRQIETLIWKKPLDKTEWQEGEMKNTKVKIIWRKKKNGNKIKT